MSKPAHRSFADDLRGRDDAALAALLAGRPDLLSPVPPDISALAARANSTPSISRALDSLNQWELEVLELMASLEVPISLKDVEIYTGVPSSSVVSHLYRICLIYKDEGAYRIPSGVRDTFGPELCGLGQRLGSRIEKIDLKDAPEASQEMLKKLTWGPSRGSVKDVKNPGPGMQWLLDQEILVIADAHHVMLPAEHAIALRGDKVHREYHSVKPLLIGESVKDADRAGAHEAAAFLMWVEDLLEAWSREPGSALRSGGMSIRELKRVAQLLGVTEACAAFVAESAFAIGLVSIDLDDRIMPTSAYDLWLARTPVERWREIAAHWLITSRAAGLCAPKEGKGVAPLGPELDRAAAPGLRTLTLELLATHSDLAPTLDSLIELVAWNRPRRAKHLQAEFVEWTVREAHWLGITGRGAFTSFARQLIADEEPTLLASQLPSLIDHVLLQGDHTAIAPGPLYPEIFREISLMAEVESRGTATVFRFSEKSLRHALDVGYDAEKIEAFIKRVSKTEMPQSLTYQIHDIAKRYGRLRVGATHSYLRCDDEAILAEAMQDKRLVTLELRRLAPTVIISPAPLEEVLETLRSHGYAPAAEGRDGMTTLTSPSSKRSKSRPRPPRLIGDYSLPSPELLTAALRALRTGEHVSTQQRTLPQLAKTPRTTASETLRFLQEMSGTGGSLWIGYADTDGGLTHRIIEPMGIAAGYVTAFDQLSGEIKRFAIARISGVATIDQ